MIHVRGRIRQTRALDDICTCIVNKKNLFFSSHRNCTVVFIRHDKRWSVVLRTYFIICATSCTICLSFCHPKNETALANSSLADCHSRYDVLRAYFHNMFETVLICFHSCFFYFLFNLWWDCWCSSLGSNCRLWSSCIGWMCTSSLLFLVIV